MALGLWWWYPVAESSEKSDRRYISRAGLKLAHALDAFEFDVTNLCCADFGCNVGGFTDCLLQRGAQKVYAIDTGYGTLAYPLRSDPRVVVMERTNALHAQPPDELVDLVTIDLAWTPQRLAIPAALQWLGAGGTIMTLIKPHYELTEPQKREHLVNGQLDHEIAEQVVLQRVLEQMPEWGVQPVQTVRSPVTGRKSAARSSAKPGQVGRGNIEFITWCRPTGVVQLPDRPVAR